MGDSVDSAIITFIFTLIIVSVINFIGQKSIVNKGKFV